MYFSIFTPQAHLFVTFQFDARKKAIVYAKSNLVRSCKNLFEAIHVPLSDEDLSGLLGPEVFDHVKESYSHICCILNRVVANNAGYYEMIEQMLEDHNSLKHCFILIMRLYIKY